MKYTYSTSKSSLAAKVLTLAFLLFTGTLFGAAPTITGVSVSPSGICLSSSATAVTVKFTPNNFSGTNTYIAKLSTSTGAFTSPATIGTLASSITGSQLTINASIPGGLAAGSSYKIEIVSGVTSSTVNPSFAIYPLPFAIAGAAATLCSGANITIGSTAVSGDTYAWASNPSGFSSTLSNPTVTPTATTTYTLTIDSTATGCTAAKSVVITINSHTAPAANAGSPATISSGGSTSIGATSVSGDTYAWSSNPSGYTSTVSNPTVSPTITTTYTLTETVTSSGCTNTNSVVITVTAPSNPALINGSKSVCASATTSYYATKYSGFSYAWFITGGTINSGQASDTVFVKWGGAGTGYLKLVQTNGSFKDSAIDTVTINGLPSAIAGSPATVSCHGATVSVGGAAVTGDTYSWSSSPSGFTSTVSNPSVSPTLTTTYMVTETVTATGCTSTNSVVITVHSLSLSGVYTIGGSSPNYPTFTAAVKALTTNGVCGPVVFNVRNGSYNEQIRIPAIAGASATNTITFQSQGGDSSKVKLFFAASATATNNYTVRLAGGCFINFKRISMSRPASGANYYGLVMDVDSGASYDTIQGNIITGLEAGQTYYLYYEALIGDPTNSNDSFNVITGNNMKYGTYGVYLYGKSYTQLLDGTVITNNKIDSCSLFGVYLFFQDNPIIDNNNIYNTGYLADGYAGGAIYLYESDDAPQISNNYCHTINTSYSIYLYYNNYTYGTSLNRCIVSNNMVILNPEITGNTNEGIYAVYNYYTDFDYNSVLDLGVGSDNEAAFLDDIYSNVQDNIFSTNGGLAVDYYGSYYTSSDYNDYYTTGPLLIGKNYVYYSTLTAWQNASSEDDHSLNVVPYFNSNSDLHTTDIDLYQKGIPVSGITTDIDGRPRNASAPDMGADEFTVYSLDAQLTAIDSPTTGNCSGSYSVYATLRNNGTTTLTSANISYTVNGGTATTAAWTGSLPSSATTYVKLGTSTFAASTLYSIVAYCTSPNGGTDLNLANDTASIKFESGLSGVYTIGGASPNYASFSAAANDLNLRGICGPVTFNVAKGTYTDRILLNEIVGSSAQNTITFQGVIADSANVTLRELTSDANTNYVISLNGTSYITFRYMSVSHLGNGYYANDITIVGGSHNVTFSHCQIERAGAYSGSYADALVYCGGSDDSNNIFNENYMYGGTYAFYYLGLYNNYNASGTVISNNIIDSADYDAIIAEWQNNMTITGNKIEGLAYTAGVLYGSIYVYGATAPVISDNKIMLNVGQPGIATYATTNGLIYNNFISIYGPSNSNIVYGVTSTNDINLGIYFNNIDMTGSNSNLTDIYVNDYLAGVYSENNIMANTAGGPGLNVLNVNDIGASNYNDYYIKGTNVASYGGTNYTTLAAFSAATTLDANSLTVNPIYKSFYNLHSTDTALAQKGVTLPAVSTDIDGKVRYSPPTIGANEIYIPAPDAGVSSIDTPSSSFCIGKKDISVTLKSYGSATLLKATIDWTVDGASQTAYNWTGSLAKGATQSGLFLGAYTFTAGSHTIKAWAISPNGKNDTSQVGDTSTLVINVIGLPAANAGSSSTICLGGSAPIGATAVSGDSYSWVSSPSGFTSTLSATNVSPTTTTTYTLTETVTSAGCSQSNSVIITVNPLPAANAGSNKALCYGGSATIGAAPVSGHTYSWASSPSGYTSTVSNPSVNPTATTTYTLTETITATGCTKSNAVTVTVNSLPVANAGSNASICFNASASIGAAAISGHSYAWVSSPSGFTSTAANPSVSPTQTTTYTLTETITATGCTNSNAVVIAVNTLPASNAGSPATICNGNSSSIGATAISGDTYSWASNPSGYTSTVSSSTVSPTATTTYTLTETITATGCTKSNSVIITVNPLPAANAGSNTSICTGSGTTIGGTAISGHTYAWVSSPSGFISTAANPSVSPTQTTTYTLTETITATGCTNSNSVVVTVNSLPTASAGANSAICPGGSASIGSTAVSGDTYAWASNPSGFTSTNSNPSVSPTITTTYTLTETITSTGCTSSNAVIITVNPVPTANAGSNKTICSGGNTTIGATAVSGDTYSWVSNPSGYTSTVSNPSVSPTQTTTYTLTETITATGCTKSNNVTVTVNPQPAANTGGNKSLCNGSGSVPLGATAVSGDTYLWSSKPAGYSNTTANPSVSPTTSTTYYLTETITATGCSKTDTVFVSVGTAPNANAGSPATICNGGSSSIGATAVSGDSYSWASSPSGYTSTTSNPSVSPTISTTYTLTETITATGCTKSNSVVITVITPVANAGADQEICVAGNATIIGPSSLLAYDKYSWVSSPSGFTSTLSNPVITPSATTKYILTVKDTLHGCTSAPDTMQVALGILISTPYGTYLGGSNPDEALSLARDKFGNTYITGFTESTSGIATSGAYQTNFGGGAPTIYHAFLAKFNCSGGLAWATYFGGNLHDRANGVATDDSGNIYITGFTSSTSGLATSGAYQTSMNGVQDVFLSKFNTSGSLLWATYLGGAGNDFGTSIAIDKSNNVYITGKTSSPSGIATSGAFQSSYTGGSTFSDSTEAFLAKFNSGGARLWSTYFGNSGEWGLGVATDSSGNVFITGVTASNAGIATGGAYQTTLAGTKDAFIAKFNGSGSRIWATYYGGNNTTLGNGIITDGSNVYIAGNTLSGTGIATSGGFQTVYGGGSLNGDAFLAKFNNGGAIQWATYYGGPTEDYGAGVDVDAYGSIYLIGNSMGNSGITTGGAYQTSNPYGTNSAFLAKFTNSGAREYGTFYGNTTNAYGIKADNSGDAYIAGLAGTIVPTSGAYQTSYGGSGDVFFAKIFTTPCNFIPAINGNNLQCQNTAAGYNAAKYNNNTYSWKAIGGSILSGKNNDTVSIQWTNSGSDTLWLVESSGVCKDSTKLVITVNPMPAVSAGGAATICSGSPATIGTASTVGNTYAWASTPSGFTSTNSNPSVSPATTTTYTLTEKITATGCTNSNTVIITVNPLPAATTGSNKSICNTSSTTIGSTAVSGNTYSWASSPSGYTSTVSNPSVNPTQATTYTLTETVTATGCSSANAVVVTVITPVAVAGNPQEICQAGNATIIGPSFLLAYDKYSWVSSPSGFTSTLSNPVVAPTVTTKYILTVKDTIHTCTSLTDTVQVSISSPVTLPFIYNFKGNSNNTGVAVARDKFGNSYVTGYTESTSGIATAGAYQTSFGGGPYDVFLAKFNCSGALEWATYYGGNGDDEAASVATDDSGNVFITGSTTGTNGIATAGAFQSTYVYANNFDGFLAKFSSSGSLLWGTYYGGNGTQTSNGVATDKAGDVYITGYTNSTNVFATSGAYQTSLAGYDDAYIAKFNRNGARLWGTYYGGNSIDDGAAVALDSFGNVYITGYTYSSSGIASSGAHQTSASGFQDAFLAKFNSNGARQWGTYYGGSKIDLGTGVATDGANIYITGYTLSTSGIATAGAYQTSFGGGINDGDAYLAKFNGSGAIVWATYYGGSDEEEAYSVYADNDGGVYFSGQSWSNNAIATSGAYQSSYAYTADGFFAKFNSGGGREYGSYFSSGNISITGITADNNGDAYFAGDGAFYAEIFTTPCSFLPAISGADTQCQNATASYSAAKYGSNTYSWKAIGGTILSGKNNDTVSVQWTNPGADTLWMFESSGVCKDSTKQIITVNPLPLAATASAQAICFGGSASIGSTAVAGDTYSWTSNPSGFTSTSANPSVSPTSTTTYTLAESITATGCTNFNTIVVTVNSLPSANAGSNTSICNTSSTSIGGTSISGDNYAWVSNPSGFTSTASNPSVNPTATTTYTLTETITATGCTQSNSVVIAVNALPIANTGSSQAICLGGSTSIGATAVNGDTYSWVSTPSGFASTSSSPGVSPTTTTTYTLTETITATGCTQSNSVVITVNPLPAAVAGSNTAICNTYGTTIGATAVGGDTYSWVSSPAGFTSSASNPAVSPTQTTTYTLTETITATGCTNSNSVAVTVNSLPLANAGSSATICNTASASIGAKAVSGDTYSWSSYPLGYSNSNSTASVSPNITTTYTLTETVTATGCTNTNSIVVTVNPLPLAIAGSNTAICSGSSTSIGATAISGDAYAWVSKPSGYTSTLANPSVAPTATTTYTLTETITATGCTQSNSVVITVNSLPAANAGSNKPICLGGNTPIGAVAVSGDTYAWSSNPSGYTSTSANPIVSPTANTTYSLTETITATGCINTGSIVITVNPLPVANTGSTQTICAGTPISIGAAAVSGDSYFWASSPSGFTSTSASPTVAPTTTTVYTLVETITATGCEKSNAVIINVNPVPAANTGGAKAVCVGFSAQIGAAAVSGDVYSWVSNPTGFTSSVSNPTITPTATGTYYLTETITNTGCSKTDSMLVYLNPPALTGGNSPLCTGSAIQLGDSALGDDEYAWSSVPAGFTDTTAHPTVSPTVTTTYILTETVRDGGCFKTDSAIITVYPVPTPNAGSPQTSCAGSGVVIGGAATSGHSYGWASNPSSMVDSTSSPTVSPTLTTTYYLTETITATGCNQSDSVVITVNPLPLANAGNNSAICLNGSASIGATAVSGDTYSWTANPTGFTDTTSNPTVSPTVTTTYYLTETITATGCNQSDSVVITVNPLPLANAGNNSAICLNGSASIGATAVSGDTYSWTANPTGFTDTTSNPTVSPTVTTTYYLTETITATGCNQSDSVVITVNPLPAANAGSNSAICLNGSASIGATAVSGDTYSWTANQTGFTDTTSNPTVSPTVTTTYYLTETITSTGCNQSDSVVITVNPLPAANAGSNSTICLNGSTSIGATAVSGDTYSWTANPTGFTDTTSNPTVDPTVTTTYYLTETITSTGCNQSGSVVITVNPLPAANAGSNSAICLNGSTSIGATAVSGDTYSWTANPAGFTDTTSNPTVNPTVTTTYYLTETITSTGCNQSDSVVITVNPLPAANVGSNGAICLNGSTSIGATAVSGDTYSWTANPIGFTDTTSNPTVSPTVTTTYYLTETITATGCNQSDSVVITVNPLPAANAGSNTAICLNGSTSIGATAISGDTYLWTANPTGFTDTTSNPTVTPTITTTYYLTETITATGCNQSDSIVITVNPLPAANAGSNSAICLNGSTTIGAISVSGDTYSWTANPTGFTDTTSNPTVSPTVTTTYYLTETITATGCNQSGSVVITVNPLPAANAGNNSAICLNGSTSIGATAVSGNTYSWTANPTGFTDTTSNPTITPTVTTTYYLTETITATGCNQSDSVVITVNPLPAANAGSNSAICLNGSASIGAIAVSGDTYSWTANPTGFTDTTSNPTVNPTVTTTYYLTETITATGCNQSDSVVITVNPLPAAIAGSNSALCLNGSTSIGAISVSGDTYSWTANPIGFIDTTSNPTVNPTVTTTYYLTETITSTGCNQSGSVVITVNPLPAANAGSNSAICLNGSTSIGAIAVSGDTYSWTANPTGFTDTTSNPTVNPTVTTTYYLTETITATGCNQSDSVVITVNPLPAANAGSNSAICLNGSTSIGATAVSGNTYSWTANPTGFTDTTSNPTVSPTITTTYYLTETITTTGCNQSDSIVITVNPLPAANAGSNSAICLNGSASIGATAVSGDTYSWTANPTGFTDTTSNPTVTPTITTTYYLTETITATGCNQSDSVVITVNPLPAAIAGSNSAICLNGSTSIGAISVSGDTYSWTANPVGFTDTTSNPTVNPTVTTTYYLTETITATGCNQSDSVVITVNPLPAANAGSNSAICLNGSASIGSTAVSGDTYSWTANPVGFTDTTSNPTVTPTVTTTYYLTETITATGCNQSDSVVITVNPLPAANAGSNNAICLNGSTSIGTTAVSGDTYSWTANPVGFTDTTSNPTVSPTVTTTYYLTETITATGCNQSDSVLITVNPLPAANAGSNSAICLNGSASIGATAVSGDTYAWTANPTGFTDTTSNPTVNPTVTATYYLTETITATGCNQSDSVVITVNPLPAANAGSNSAICLNGSTSIGATAISGDTYSWTANPTGFTDTTSNPTVSPTIITTYYLTETITATGCNKSDSVVVTVNPLPSAITGSNQSICNGSFTFIGDSVSVIGNTYSWTSHPTGFTDSTSNPIITPTVTTTYYLTETITATGCNKSDSVVVTVNPLPSASISGTTITCANSAVNYKAPYAANITYKWAAINGSIVSGQGTDSVIVSWGATKGAISLVEQNTSSCSDSVADSVNVFTLPSSPISGSLTACTKDITRYSAAYLAGNTYNWTVSGGLILAGQTNDTVYVKWTSTGLNSIIVHATNLSSCFSVDTLAITITATPTLPVILPGNGDTLMASPDSAASYQWYLNGTAITGATGDKYATVSGGSYTVIASNGSCSSDTSVVYGVSAIGVVDNVITSFKLYPNPAQTTVNIGATFAKPTTIVVELLNTLGQTIVQLGPQRVSAGEYNNSFYVGGLARGMYYLKITTGSGQVVQRIMKE